MASYKTKNKKPVFIQEPYGIPYELTQKDKFRLTTLKNEKLISSEGKYHLLTYDNENTGKRSYVIVNENTGMTEFPSVYGWLGTIGYDSPERIPKKVRDKFNKIMVSGKEQK